MQGVDPLSTKTPHGTLIAMSQTLPFYKGGGEVLLTNMLLPLLWDNSDEDDEDGKLLSNSSSAKQCIKLDILATKKFIIFHTVCDLAIFLIP